MESLIYEREIGQAETIVIKSKLGTYQIRSIETIPHGSNMRFLRTRSETLIKAGTFLPDVADKKNEASLKSSKS